MMDSPLPQISRSQRAALESLVGDQRSSPITENARAAGGTATLPMKRRAKNRRLEESVADHAPHPNNRQRHQSKNNAQQQGRLRTNTQNVDEPGTIKVLHSDVERGAWSMIERGLLPSNFDMQLIMEGPRNKHTGVANNPLQCARAPMHKTTDAHVRKETQTGAASAGGFSAVKFDVRSLAEMPHDREKFVQAMQAKAAMLAMEPTPAMKLAQVQNTTKIGRDARSRRRSPMSNARHQPPHNILDNIHAEQQQQRDDNDDQLTTKEREDTRSYAQLLDKFSLHEFIIRKGVTLRNTPEFNSFHRSNSQKWSAINDVILHLERLLFETAVPVAYVDGKRVVDLATVDNGVCTRDQLLSCLANRDEIEPLVTSMSHKFLFAPKRFDLAACVIQATYRGFRQFKQYKLLHAANLAAVRIQKQYAVHREHKATQRKLKIAKETLLEKWDRTMEKFAKDWLAISRSSRVIIHVPSVAVGSDHHVPVFAEFFQRQILPRLSALDDRNVESIVMLSPSKPDDDTLQYYLNTLQSAGVRRAEGRVSVLVPELVAAAATQAAGVPRRSRVKLPSLTLTKMVLCSSRLMRLLAAHVKGKSAYMVCDIITEDEQLLAAKIGVPILGCPSPNTCMLFSTKAGGRQLLSHADVNIPVGATGIRTQDELYLALSKLIVENPTVHRWIIKLDAESNGRGIAVLDTKRIRSFDDVVKLFEHGGGGGVNNNNQQGGGMSPSSPATPASAALSAPGGAGASGAGAPTVGAATAVAAKIYGELKDVAARRIKISLGAAYPDWAAYVAAMKRMSCVVEAAPNDIVGSPVAHLFIPPNPSMEPQVLGIQQQIVSPLTFLSVGVVYPQTCVPDEALYDASQNIAQVLRRHGVVGHVSVDYVVFRKETSSSSAMTQQQQQQQHHHNSNTSGHQQKEKKLLRMWAVGVRPCFTINSAIHEFACVLRGEKIAMANTTTDISFRSSIRPPFCYSYTGVIFHPHIAALKHSAFFQIARQRGLSFEAEATKEFQDMCAVAAANGDIIMGGTVFHLIDSLLCGAVGALFLGPTPARCAQLFMQFTELLHQQLSAENALLDDPRGNLLHLLAAARTFSVMYGLASKKGSTKV